MTEPRPGCEDPARCGLCRHTSGDDGECTMADLGYVWCRPCGESHRGDECAIDEQGRSLRWCGHPWEPPCAC